MTAGYAAYAQPSAREMRRQVPTSRSGGSPFGVYVHIPFCRERCDYCAFATYSDRDHLMRSYVEACVEEIERAYGSGDLPPASSVFFGGGTPSRLPPEDLVTILRAIPLKEGAEVTVECNPEDAQIERLSVYASAGVTRMSFGVESTLEHVLATLGRTSSASERADETGGSVPEMLADDVCQVGFKSWNLDLIYGAASETHEDWHDVLVGVVSMSCPPPHLSLYALTVEPGTPLASDPSRYPDDDVQAERYEYASAFLSAHGYVWEEISNWALPGHACRHNDLYWSQGNYLGVGSGAHSHVDGRRWWNMRTPERYIRAIKTGSSPVAGEETLSEAEREFEELALSLRTRRGVPESALPTAPADLVLREGGRAVLNVRGRLVANDLTARLVTGAAL
ncbi:MAG: radical SAM family heme chaperone HemW [Acidimicrobiales bacterium]